MKIKKMKYVQHTSELCSKLPLHKNYITCFRMILSLVLSPPVQQVKISQQTPQGYLVGTRLGSWLRNW